MTYTCATMEVSPAVYDEILGKLKAAGYEHAIGKDGMLDMTHLGLQRGPVLEGDTPRTDAELFEEHWGGKHVRADFARGLERELTAALGNAAELQAGFDLRWKADMRAIKRWQEATGEHDTWPDHADLCVWLMEQRAAIDDALDFEPDAQHSIADMANCGKSLMEAIARLCPAYCWNESPAEIVGDLLNEIEEWMPIETAPHDIEVLVWREDCGILIAKFTGPHRVMSEAQVEEVDFPDGFEEWWTDGHGWLEGQERPTKWKPMPKGPSA